jgi:PAS domain S-box-containing protein
MRYRSQVPKPGIVRAACRIALLGAWGMAAEALQAQTVARLSPDPTVDPARYVLDLWAEPDGLPQNFVSAIAQTPDGYLWLGSEEGLVRFDGVRFTVYSPENTPALTTSMVFALWADADGTLWVGTRGGGLVRLRDGEFKAYTSADGLSDDRVRAVYRDRAGRLWVGTEGGGVNRFEDGRFEVIDASRGLSNDYVLSIAEDAEGAVWFGTAAGLNRWDGEAIRAFGVADGLPSERVTALVGGRDGSLWIGTGRGVARLRDGRFTMYGTREGLSNGLVTSLFEDEAGALWIGTHGGGLNRLYDGRIDVLTTARGLPSDMVWTIYGDRVGNLWLGQVAAGLVRLRDGSFSVYGRPEGLSADVALAVLEDRSGVLWAGTAGGGVTRIDGDRVTTYTTANGLTHDIVISLAEGRNGEIWVGTAVDGLSRIYRGEVRTYGRDDGVVPGPVGTILEDRAGGLWLGTHGNGLQRWRPGPPVTYTRSDGLPDDHVTVLREDTAGRLWIGTRGGLARLEGGRIVNRSEEPWLPGESVGDLYDDGEGRLWIATASGLARLRGDRLYRYDAIEGLRGIEFHAIVGDDRGYLWMSANRGIARVLKAELDAVAEGRGERVTVEWFGRADGLRSVEANGGVKPAGWRRRDGTIWFPTMRGFAVVDPARVVRVRPSPRPLVERVLAGDSVVVGRSALNLPPDYRNLEFHFTAPNHVAPEEIRFRYRLEGFNADWIDAGPRRTAYYTNLPPGRFRFRVQAAREGGDWIESDSAVELSLAPRFYETGLFGVLVLLTLAALVVGAHRLRVRRLTERQQMLLRVVLERERTERALRQSEERLRLALEAGRMGTWEWNIADGTISWSPTMVDLFGFAPATAREAMDRLPNLVDPRDRDRVKAAIEGICRDRPTEFQLDFGVALADGEIRYVDLRGRIDSDETGRPVRVVGVVSDITTLMSAQEALRRREEELRQAQKMEAVGRLAGGIAHDFNNLLNVIGGHAELLLGEVPRESPLRRELEEIDHASRRAAALTQQLLAFSRKQVLQPKVLDLNEVIAGVERMLRRLIPEDITLETRLDPGLDPVRADPVGIEQILVNLVVNARDAIPGAGRITIRTANVDGEGELGDRVVGSVSPGPHVIFSVTDTGRGMDDETRRRIFEPFFTTKEVGQGTGLGLSTVYGIVEQSGGWIDVSSAPGRGTTITVHLPRVEARQDRAARADLPAPASKPGAETILLVEDEDAVRALARKVLERSGYTVLEAANGWEALEICERSDSPIHILVSDVVMPGIGGRDLAERVVRLRPGTRVLFMSGYAEDEVLRRGALHDGIAFLPKPFSPAALVRRVREVLDGAAPEFVVSADHAP